MKKLILPRRKLLTGAVASLCAPAIARSQLLVTGVGAASQGGGAGGPWTPASLGANLLGWYDASVTSSLLTTGLVPVTADGQGVIQWNDLSSHGNNLSIVDTSHTGVYHTTAMNGHPTISVVQPAVYHNTSFAWVSGGVGCFFMVMNIAGTSQLFARIIQYGGSPNERSLLLTNVTTTMAGFDGSQLSPQTIPNSPTNMQLGGVWNGSNFVPYVNNTAGSPTASVFTAAIPQEFSFPGNATQGIDGNYSEIVATSTDLAGTGHLLDIHNYFLGKWGV